MSWDKFKELPICPSIVAATMPRKSPSGFSKLLFKIPFLHQLFLRKVHDFMYKVNLGTGNDLNRLVVKGLIPSPGLTQANVWGAITFLFPLAAGRGTGRGCARRGIGLRAVNGCIRQGLPAGAPAATIGARRPSLPDR